MFRSWGVALLILLPSTAWAQDYTITLSPQELTYIGSLLAKQPYNEVNTLLQKLSTQVDKQNAEAQAKEPEGAEQK